MEILKTLGLSLKDVSKISKDLGESIQKLDSLVSFAESKNAPKHIKDFYKNLKIQVENYLLSEDFVADAREKGITVSKIILPIEEVVVAQMPKAKSLREIIAEKQKQHIPDETAEVVQVSETPVETQTPELPKEIEESITTETPTVEELPLPPSQEVVVEEPSQEVVEGRKPSLRDIIAARKQQIPQVPDVAEVVQVAETPVTTEIPVPPLEEVIVTEIPATPIIAEEPIVPIVQEETPIETVETHAPEAQPSVSASTKKFGIKLTGENSAEVTGRELLSMILSYGGCDYMMGYYDSPKGYIYRLSLPNSLAELFITLPITELNKDIKSINEAWYAYFLSPIATIKIIGNSENQLQELVSILGGGATSIKYVGNLDNDELSSEIFGFNNYEVVNSEYSKSLMGAAFMAQTYWEIGRDIKNQWKESKDFSLFTNAKTHLVHGLYFADYIYQSAEKMYHKGGDSIVVQSQTFYVPKGLKKDEIFAENGLHLKSIEDIKLSKFEKDVEIGKRFQGATDKFDKANICRCTSSDSNNLYFISNIGEKVKMPIKTYNYFKKYYGDNVQVKISGGSFLFVVNDVVGLCLTQSSGNNVVVDYFDIDSLKIELRNINSEAFDFMVEESPKEVIALPKVEVEVQEEVDNLDNLKREIADRIEFLEDLRQDAVEDNNKPLIEELDMEIESLKDLLVN